MPDCSYEGDCVVFVGVLVIVWTCAPEGKVPLGKKEKSKTRKGLKLFVFIGQIKEGMGNSTALILSQQIVFSLLLLSKLSNIHWMEEIIAFLFYLCSATQCSPFWSLFCNALYFFLLSETDVNQKKSVKTDYEYLDNGFICSLKRMWDFDLVKFVVSIFVMILKLRAWINLMKYVS